MPVPITMPELGMPRATLSLWFAEPGELVYEGDRLVEILAGPATFDVSAPATGRLLERFALANDPVSAGQVLGTLEEEADRP
jgi:pyruvate/2-oxoglutarate dehydrogenase complex dihydrolipoamide acyltransferase (E2) component